jgi:Cdc6-like AAA superfamily ATPase
LFEKVEAVREALSAAALQASYAAGLVFRSADSGGTIIHEVTSTPGRENEHSSILGWVKRHLLDGIGGAMYITGGPGIGKTLTIANVLDQLAQIRRKTLGVDAAIPTESDTVDLGYKVIWINAATYPTGTNACFAELAGAVGLFEKKGGTNQSNCQSLLRDKFREPAKQIFIDQAVQQSSSKASIKQTPQSALTILVIDESDMLNKHVLTEILQIAVGDPTFTDAQHSKPRSSLLFIGLGNNVTLLDQISTSASRSMEEVQRVIFSPYDINNLLAIVGKIGGNLFDDKAALLLANTVLKTKKG